VGDGTGWYDMHTLDELLAIIKERIDPDELIDILGLTTDDLVQELFEKIADNRDKIIEYLELEDE